MKKQMSYKDFKEKYMKPSKFFDFSLFKIVCKKCGSSMVEFGGEMEVDTDNCYYAGDIGKAPATMVCKCHKCGNGFKLEIE